MTNTQAVLHLVAHERQRQQDKWGEQNHPNIAPVPTATDAAEFYGIPTARTAKALTDQRARVGRVTWADILIEELAEAIEAAALYEQAVTAAGCEQPTARRLLATELVQTAAVAVQWAEKLIAAGDAQ